jgi:predicted flap endonuclease-1-like 5' DNA nuclease
MGHLTDDMTNLRDEMDFLRKNRGAFLSDLKHGTTQLQSNVTDMLEVFKNDRAEMAGKLKSDLHTFMAGVNEYVSDLKEGVSDMKEEFRDDHAEIAARLRDDLGNFALGIRSHVSDMKEKFKGEHAHMTGKSKAEREAFFSAVRHSVAELQEEVAGLLKTFADDLTGARRSWSSSSHVGKRAKREKAGPQAKGQAKGEKTVEKLFPDDLTLIKGIGPGRNKTLNDAGIRTFARLAASTPEELRQIFGESVRMADADLANWIKQAKRLIN